MSVIHLGRSRYITCTVGSEIVTTSVKRQTLVPEWNEQLEFSTGQGNQLAVECFDWDSRGEDDPMGSVHLDLTDVGEKTKTLTTTLLLDGERVGEMIIRLRRWQPTMTKAEAALLMQRSFRGYTARSSFQKAIAANVTIDAVRTVLCFSYRVFST
jgi:Ca2+-dependent lipid-binding protein